MDKIDGAEQRLLWRSLTGALGAEIREPTVLSGISGIQHPVLAIAEDEARKRLIVISAEPSARFAAMMQVDIQSAYPEHKVSVARPILIDIGMLARRALQYVDSDKILISSVSDSLKSINALPEETRNQRSTQMITDLFGPVISATKAFNFATLPQIVGVATQLSMVDWRRFIQELSPQIEAGVLDLARFSALDTTADDRKFGICPIPLYEFGEQDREIFTSDRRLDEAKTRLDQMGISQYFFPPPDQIALGLIERGMNRESEVVRAVDSSDRLGHPLARPELLHNLSDVSDLVKELASFGYVTETDLGWETSGTGTTVRGEVKIRPREGLISKILSRFSVNLSASPKDFMH